MLDHVTSNTGLVLPLERLAHLCESRGSQLIVDGAHGLLAQPLDMAQLGNCGVPCYISNGHKWLCTPKGVAFMWVKAGVFENVAPVIISHGSQDGMSSQSKEQNERGYFFLARFEGVVRWAVVGLGGGVAL